MAKINSSDIPPEKAIEYVNQLHEISKAESVPLKEIPNYIQEKLEEKKKSKRSKRLILY